MGLKVPNSVIEFWLELPNGAAISAVTSLGLSTLIKLGCVVILGAQGSPLRNSFAKQSLLLLLTRLAIDSLFPAPRNPLSCGFFAGDGSLYPSLPLSLSSLIWSVVLDSFSGLGASCPNCHSFLGRGGAVSVVVTSSDWHSCQMISAPVEIRHGPGAAGACVGIHQICILGDLSHGLAVCGRVRRALLVLQRG